MTVTIVEGQTFPAPCFSKNLSVGDRVQIARAVGPFIGRPIAEGVCVKRMQDDPRSVLRPTKQGKRRANVWRNYFEIRVMEIF